MQVQNTNQLSAYMDELKAWAKKHQFLPMQEAIEHAEQTAFTASELIIKYGEVLTELKAQIPSSLPAEYREQWDRAIEVSVNGVKTIEYPEGSLSVFDFGNTKPFTPIK